FAVQTNIVRQDGRRSVLLTLIKKGGASTLTIVKQLKALLPSIRAAAPPGLEVKELFDQSLFVRAAIAGVLTEGAIAACLTGLMILLFLGSWRSTLVVITSIPLSILTSLAILSAIGQTLNVMTLGGLALAVGILVDDATVEIENIHRNLGLGKRLVQAILDGAQQIATPAFVSTLSICIVFVPPFSRRDFFPTVDTGQFRLHVRAPAGTRIEETEQVFADVEAAIRRLIPKDQVQLVIDNIGQPQPINLAFTDSVTLGPSDGEILVSLNPERHR